MTAVLVILVVLALVFGAGAVVKGVLWALLIGLVVMIIAGYALYRKLRKMYRERSTALR